MPRLRHERDGRVYACPACDGTGLYERTGNGNATNHPERPYRCEDCGVALQYVIERPSKDPRKTGQTTLGESPEKREFLARELEARSPDELGLSAIGERRMVSSNE